MSDALNAARMVLALDDLTKQDVPNLLGTSKKWEVNRTTLTRQFRGTQMSRADFLSESIQCLSRDQEKVVLGFINKLTDRNCMPTSQIVKNVAEEVAGQPVGKNWVGRFVRRYQDQLHAGFLRTIDSARVKADNIDLYRQFYEQVSLYILSLYNI